MARLDLTRLELTGSIDPAVVANAGQLPLLADGAQVDLLGGEMIILYNPTAGAINATLQGAPDQQGRDVDSVQSVAVDGFAVYGPLEQSGWRQADGKAYLDVAADGLECIVVYS